MIIIMCTNTVVKNLNALLALISAGFFVYFYVYPVIRKVSIYLSFFALEPWVFLWPSRTFFMPKLDKMSKIMSILRSVETFYDKREFLSKIPKLFWKHELFSDLSFFENAQKSLHYPPNTRSVSPLDFQLHRTVRWVFTLQRHLKWELHYIRRSFQRPVWYESNGLTDRVWGAEKWHIK